MPIRLPLPMPVTFLWAIAAASAAGLIAFSYFAKPGEGTIGLLGTLLGFLLTTVVNRTSEQSQDDKRMRTARMCLANDLRHWLNAASDVVDDERYFESSDGNIGKLRYELPAFRFEHDLMSSGTGGSARAADDDQKPTHRSDVWPAREVRRACARSSKGCRTTPIVSITSARRSRPVPRSDANAERPARPPADLFAVMTMSARTSVETLGARAVHLVDATSIRRTDVSRAWPTTRRSEALVEAARSTFDADRSIPREHRRITPARIDERLHGRDDAARSRRQPYVFDLGYHDFFCVVAALSRTARRSVTRLKTT